MPNIELLEKSMPVAPIRIAALAGCRELAEEVDKKLVKFRKELVAAKKSTIIPQGYAEKSFLVDCECPRFGTGEGKGYIKESVRGTDLYIMVDVTNYRPISNRQLNTMRCTMQHSAGNVPTGWSASMRPGFFHACTVNRWR